MNKYGKTILKEFKTGFGRFIAIMAIIALGVGFLIGVMQATPDMEKSMDDYYRAESAYDVDVKSVVGLTQADIDALLDLKDENGDAVVGSLTPVISTDVMAKADEAEVVARVMYIDRANAATSDATEADAAASDTAEPGTEAAAAEMNRLTLVEGSMPKEGLTDAEGNEIPLVQQVVVERSTRNFTPLSVGDKITLDAESGQYGDVYAQTEFTVVGIVSSPDYYYLDATEQTTLGTGVVGCVVYVNDGVYDLFKESMSLFSILNNESLVQLIDPDAQAQEIKYTDCWVKLEGADSYAFLTDEYKSYVTERADLISSLGDERCSDLNETIGNFGYSARWLTLDRASTNVSYVSFDMNVEKVADIAGIFPIFFIIVAALVAFTSMTRMVEEDRMQIGTLKALGYRPARIVSKYLIYCCIACIIGCAAGILIGFSLLPSIFWAAYQTLYYLPALNLAFSPWFAVAVIGILVTLAACWTSLRERPSKLMQPKAPKAGKRVLLERVPFIWKPLKFKWKATIRNIFRYKKNMILTIISVMGCTALILVGFGLNDSVTAASQYQYQNVILYESAIEYTGAWEEGGTLDTFLDESDGYLSVYADESTTLDIPQDGREDAHETVTLYLVADDAEFNKFISLHVRGDSAIIEVAESTESAIVLSENIAAVYGIEAGDTLTMDGKEVTVLAVCEGYTGVNVYMSRAAYESVYNGGAAVTPNMLLVKSDVGRENVDEATRGLLTDPAVTSVDFIYSSLSMFENLSEMMGLVIAVLVISAGALAAIVLYNLTNINIDERKREIATLRVLGYRKAEVAGYIYRESAILTIVGTLFGLLLGWLLHMYIVTNVNSISMMFGRVIGGLSYLWAFLLTIAFAVIVYAFMLIKLNKISMADSLKSNE